ncbi:hypothetical protein A0130_12635 [Leifsonia xyli]|nr:hypothetical protein A0130_12635 [Leifsonia xyli]
MAGGEDDLRVSGEVEPPLAGELRDVLDARHTQRAGLHHAGDGADRPRVQEGIDERRVLALVAVGMRGEAPILGVHEHRDAELLDRPLGEPDVVEVPVGQHDALQVAHPQAHLVGCVHQRTPGLRERRIHERPGVAVGQEVAVRGRVLEPMDARHDLRRQARRRSPAVGRQGDGPGHSAVVPVSSGRAQGLTGEAESSATP